MSTLRSYVCAALMLMLTGLPATPRAESVPVPRLRPQNARVAGWLSRGLAQSATMRALAERIEEGDVIVFLETKLMMSSGVAAYTSWIGSAPPMRYLRATLRTDLNTRDTLAMLAHELQHVVEVIDNPSVTSEASLVELYQRIGHRTGRNGRQWDTPEALRTGAQVRLEVAGA